MEFQVPIQIKPLDPPVSYNDNIMLVGSCFTEHIGNYLQQVKFRVMQNPNGILFEPLGVCNSLISYIEQQVYTGDDLVYLNEAWHSWQHHSRFSGTDKELVVEQMNQSQKTAHVFLKKANWLVITLGSSFVYKLASGTDFSPAPGSGNINVVNCHKAPAQIFNKHLSTIEEIVTAFDSAIHRLMNFNPSLKIIFTISPVRHLRDGVLDNNRSKARLIEAVHHLVNKFSGIYYFPAYELVIDVLRDYRFYDIDMAHPNYAATQFVLEKFTESCMHPATAQLAADIRKLVIARNHKPFNPASSQHRHFLSTQLQKVQLLAVQYPYLNFAEELEYFGNG